MPEEEEQEAQQVRPGPGVCGHWVGAELRYCEITEGIRYYLPGWRCAGHTPAALEGRPEPEPGPGWPIYRKAAGA